MAKIKEICFELGVSQVKTSSLDKLIELVDTYRESCHENLDGALNNQEGAVLHKAITSLTSVPSLQFSLYSLIIVHCYTIVENNRKKIFIKYFGSKDFGMSKIKYVNSQICGHGIHHESIQNFDVAEEFRLVNNEIKHNRYNNSDYIEAKGRKYYWKDLRSLYLEKAKNLDVYLSDLLVRVKEIKSSPKVDIKLENLCTLPCDKEKKCEISAVTKE